MVNAVWQVVAAYLFALAGGGISTSLNLGHKPLCALISFAAGTLLGVTLFAILPEGLSYSGALPVVGAAATGYLLFFFISKHVHHVCPACAASHFDADATRHFSEIATALIVALAIHSTTDGLALGIQQDAPSLDATKWSLFSALCIHKIPEGLALGSLLIGAGLATFYCARVGGSCRSNYAPRRRDRYVVAGESLHFLAWLDHGACRRRISLSGHARCGWRNAQAWQETCADKFFDRNRFDRDSQCWTESASLRCCVALRTAKRLQ